MKYCDRLYGKAETGNLVEEMMACEKIRRLKNISLSAVPDAFLVPNYFKDMASRLEHSVGVSHLIGILCDFRPEFKEFRNALLLSAICHDAGAPPFSHNGEHLLEELTRMRHEQYIGHLLKGSAAEDVIKKYGYTLKEIAEIINGKGTIGKLVNNNIDIDNMDNTERYGFSSGMVGRISSPEKLAKAFMLKGNNLYLDGKFSGEMEKWKECRKTVYGGIVYGDTNISAGGMLIRALGFVYEEKGRQLLKDGFLLLADSGALQYMERNCDSAKILIEKARSGVLFKKAAEIISANPSKSMEKICKDWKERLELAGSVSDRLNLARTDVCVGAFARKPERDANNFYPPKTEIAREKKAEIIFDIRVFVNPKARINAKNMQKILCELTGMQ
ncbi:MAG: HD domain-containing protein [Nanoarchaeota archaeon]|nr:HD domain-containing protein [Nanoarchaeota archaeon]